MWRGRQKRRRGWAGAVSQDGGGAKVLVCSPETFIPQTVGTALGRWVVRRKGEEKDPCLLGSHLGPLGFPHLCLQWQQLWGEALSPGIQLC